jgi:hypothetical protein
MKASINAFGAPTEASNAGRSEVLVETIDSPNCSSVGILPQKYGSAMLKPRLVPARL